MDFCTDCGSPLGPLCGRCGNPAGVGERFCGRCGDPLAVTAATAFLGPPPEGERKQVTVLFADVARSMELAERLDADEWTQIMQRLFAVCTEAVERFGGTVDKFTGDGVMALFGAPVAQEDHARRACHAALRLVEGAGRLGAELRPRGVELGVRVGLNSGEVVAGSAGVGAYTAVGHTVGLAQRMESLSSPGVVYLSEHTAGLVGGAFRLRDLGRVEVRGSVAPVGVFALESAPGGPLAAGRRRPGSARLVGRVSELAALEACLAEAIRRRALVIGIVGEAGAGKSRLCEELARRAAELGVTVRRTAGVSHATSVALLPILGLFRDVFGVAEADTPGEVREKVAARLLGLHAAFSDDDLSLVFDFLEVPDPVRPLPLLGPEARRRRILEVLRQATALRSERETLLLIFEDLHWFDLHSVAFLEAWLPSFRGTRTLVVTNFRPEFHAPWMRRSDFRPLPLAPLEDPAVDELLGVLLGPDPGLATLAGELRARAGGNPFFVEEIVRALAGDGTLDGDPGAYRLVRPEAEVRVPPTVQAVLAGRIDRLTARDKAVLQAAAVIGRTFADVVLAAVTGLDTVELHDSLQVLCTEELLHVTGTAGEYRFWHPLTQEVAYGTLLTAARRRLHRGVGEALVRLGPGRQGELAALVVTHFESAGEHLETARWQLRASTSVMRSDIVEAQRRLRAALGHLASVPETDESLALWVRAATLLLRLGGSTGMDVAEADSLYADARPAAERLGDPALFTSLYIADAAIRLYGGDHVSAEVSLAESLRWADRTGVRALRAFVWSAVALTSAYRGPLRKGLSAVETVRALCGDDPTSTEGAGYSLHDAACLCEAVLRIPAGPLGEAHRKVQAALACFEQRPMAHYHSWTLSLFAPLADWMGEEAEAGEAERLAGEALRLARDAGSAAMIVEALQSAGIAALLGSRPDDAAATFSEALAEARKHRAGQLEEASLLAHLGRAHLALADAAAARTSADEAVAVAQRQGAKVVECLAHLVRARVWRQTTTSAADLAEARAALSAGEILATEAGAATYAAFLAEERARLDPCPGALRAAAAGYAAVGATGHTRRLQQELGAI